MPRSAPSGIRNRLKGLESKIKEPLQAWLYDRHHVQAAKRTYQAIVDQIPEHALDDATRGRIREYGRDVLGSGRFAPWLETYAAYRGAFLEGWIPNNYFGRILVPSWRIYPRIDTKTIGRRILGTDRLPDLAYHINGTWLDTNREILSQATVKDVLFKSHSHVFVKLDGSSQGKGVSKIAKADFDAAAIAARGNLVIQAPIRQHQFFDELSPDSVATLRITTVKLDGAKAERRASFLRIGLKEMEVVRARDELDVSIVDGTGALDRTACDDRWRMFREHPDTGAVFAGMIVPGFEKAVRFCEDLHDSSPFSTVVGWDIAIDRDREPVLIEWNTGHVEIAHTEASVGPSFRGLGWEDIWKRV